jgi:hypothetical protein
VARVEILKKEGEEGGRGDGTSVLDSRVSTRFWEKRTGVSLGRGLVGSFV